jgi:hypothetical protein
MARLSAAWGVWRAAQVRLWVYGHMANTSTLSCHHHHTITKPSSHHHLAFITPPSYLHHTITRCGWRCMGVWLTGKLRNSNASGCNDCGTRGEGRCGAGAWGGDARWASWRMLCGAGGDAMWRAEQTRHSMLMRTHTCKSARTWKHNSHTYTHKCLHTHTLTLTHRHCNSEPP